MNKAELVAAIAAEADLSKAAAQKALEAGIKAAIDALKKGDNVQLIGFGTLSVVERAARTGVNPANGKKIAIPSKKVVKFKASKAIEL